MKIKAHILDEVVAKLASIGVEGESAAFVEAMLRQAASYDAKREAVYRALRAAHQHDGCYPFIYQMWDEAIVYNCGQDLYSRTYTMADGKVTLGEETKVEVVYTPVKEGEAAEFSHELTTFREAAAVAENGDVTLTLIRAGQGSSAYYPASVLKRDGPKVFTAGTQMFINHQTEAEEAARPEGDLKDLVGRLTSDAWWDEASQSLKAKANITRKWFREAVNELVSDPKFGVSIRALGTSALGRVAGKATRVMKSMVKARSVDWVTAAGAGGKVEQVLESARAKSGGYDREDEDEEEMDQAKFEESQRANEALKLKLAAAGARLIAVTKVSESALPKQAKDRLVVNLTSATPPMKDGELDEAAFTTAVTESIRTEAEYIASLTGAGKVRGMGGATEQEEEQPAPNTHKVLESANGRLDSAISRLLGASKEGK